MIRLSGVSKTYVDGSHRHRVLDGVELELESGAFVAILGQSGSGKSTLLNIIGGLDTQWEGEAEVCGEKLHSASDRVLSGFRNASVAFVFQAFNLLDPLTALENVLLPSWFSAKEAVDEDLSERARAALERVGLGDKMDRMPNRLSGGERQRVAIARALAVQPRLLLCDEPTGNLDQDTGREVIELFTELHAEGMTLLMVTHEARVSERAQRVYRLQDGKLMDADPGEGVR